jgi:hypothetical protein
VSTTTTRKSVISTPRDQGDEHDEHDESGQKRAEYILRGLDLDPEAPDERENVEWLAREEARRAKQAQDRIDAAVSDTRAEYAFRVAGRELLSLDDTSSSVTRDDVRVALEGAQKSLSRSSKHYKLLDARYIA